MLDYIDRVEKHKREDREIRLALIAAGISPGVALPEIFGKTTVEEDDEAELPDDTEGVTYVFTGDAPADPQSIEQELRELAAAAARGTASFESTYSEWM